MFDEQDQLVDENEKINLADEEDPYAQQDEEPETEEYQSLMIPKDMDPYGEFEMR